jgi:predicted DNA-binding WGR domain protein
MIIALVEYINRNGQISMKSFTTEESLQKFIAKLESKNTKHLVTRL